MKDFALYVIIIFLFSIASDLQNLNKSLNTITTRVISIDNNIEKMRNK
jgi:hypothetical protein